MKTLSLKDSLSFGWGRFKARPWFFIILLLVVIAISIGVGVIEGIFSVFLGKGVGGFVSFFVSFPIDALVAAGVTAIYLAAYTHVESPKLKDLWHPQEFLQFLFATALLCLIVTIGFVLLIIPGIIAFLAFGFTQLIVIDKKLPAIEALKESARITKGHRIKLLFFVLAIIGVNLLGALALFVGLLVTIPVSTLAMVHVYRILDGNASDSVITPEREASSSPDPDETTV